MPGRAGGARAAGPGRPVPARYRAPGRSGTSSGATSRRVPRAGSGAAGRFRKRSETALEPLDPGTKPLRAGGAARAGSAAALGRRPGGRCCSALGRRPGLVAGRSGGRGAAAASRPAPEREAEPPPLPAPEPEPVDGARTPGTLGAPVAGTSGVVTAGTPGVETPGASGVGTAGTSGTGTAGTSGAGADGTEGAWRLGVGWSSGSFAAVRSPPWAAPSAPSRIAAEVAGTIRSVRRGEPLMSGHGREERSRGDSARGEPLPGSYSRCRPGPINAGAAERPLRR